MKFNIQTWKGNKILRNVSSIIEKNEIKRFSAIWDSMIKFIKDPENWWVWLAAPQIWFNKRLICVSLLKSYDDECYKTIFMINPVIIEFSSELWIDNEWCLSVPKKFWEVERSEYIKVKFLDSKWNENILALNGISARIVQHEVDHLDWILFIDKLIEKENTITDKHLF